MKYESDKFKNGFLVCEYLSLLDPLRYKKITLLEIGIGKGGSLEFWADYFKNPESKIVGIDINLPKVEKIDIKVPRVGIEVKLPIVFLTKKKGFSKNVIVYECDQNDSLGLKNIAEKHGPFDIIIDDASHQKIETENCFNVLFDHVIPGGYYVIEDWASGYWFYPGMVEVVTNIIHRAPQLKIEGMNIILTPQKSIAFFKKGDTG